MKANHLLTTGDPWAQDTHLPTHTHLCTPPPSTAAFRSLKEDKSKSDWRVNGPPPAPPGPLRLHGHRQLDREDPTGPTVVMVQQSSSLSPHRTHTHTHTHSSSPQARSFSFVLFLSEVLRNEYLYLTTSNVLMWGLFAASGRLLLLAFWRGGAPVDKGPDPDLISFFWIRLLGWTVFFLFVCFS